MPASPFRPSVTVLCGFLGAGKTTVLNHLLRYAGNRRWAAIVNDMASINIDAPVVRTRSGGALKEIVQLENGCVCCSSRDQLAESLAELAASGEYEHILVETSGVAEPRAVANLFIRRNPFGRTLGDFATLSALVTVVDGPAFLHAWQPDHKTAGRRQVAGGSERPLIELMVEQVECADVLLLNKADCLSADEQVRAKAILDGLNGRAEHVPTAHGQVPPEIIVGRQRFDASATLGSARWIRALNAIAPGARSSPVERPPADVAPHHELKYGLRSFTYQARRPFARERFEEEIARGMAGLVRAKGFFWLKEQPDEIGFLSVAGGVVRYDFLGYWWAALIEGGKAHREDRPAGIVAAWQEPHGERRQELVFIGVGLDEPRIRRVLDECLV